MSDPDAKEFRRLARLYVAHHGVEDDSHRIDSTNSLRAVLGELNIWTLDEVDGLVIAVLFPEGGGNCQVIHDYCNSMAPHIGGPEINRWRNERLRDAEKVRQPYLEALRSALILERLADV